MSDLYQLAAAYRDVAAQLADADLDEQTIADTLEAFASDIGLEAKAVAIAKVIKNIEAHARAVKDAADKMAERHKAASARATRIREYLRDALVGAGLKKIQAVEFDIRVTANPDAVDITDENKIPAMYMVQPDPPLPWPDKRSILDAHKAGHPVPGTAIRKSTRVDIR